MLSDLAFLFILVFFFFFVETLNDLSLSVVSSFSWFNLTLPNLLIFFFVPFGKFSVLVFLSDCVLLLIMVGAFFFFLVLFCISSLICVLILSFMSFLLKPLMFFFFLSGRFFSTLLFPPSFNSFFSTLLILLSVFPFSGTTFPLESWYLLLSPSPHSLFFTNTGDTVPISLVFFSVLSVLEKMSTPLSLFLLLCDFFFSFFDSLILILSFIGLSLIDVDVELNGGNGGVSSVISGTFTFKYFSSD
mmetsp:Transcript_16788/g.16780  ORF Transcript_16788/g.16780 Transcript_16788/m.16780 type:complete len:245 (-) Transcript_16788:680-1414(-)